MFKGKERKPCPPPAPKVVRYYSNGTDGGGHKRALPLSSPNAPACVHSLNFDFDFIDF